MDRWSMFLLFLHVYMCYKIILTQVAKGKKGLFLQSIHTTKVYSSQTHQMKILTLQLQNNKSTQDLR